MGLLNTLQDRKLFEKDAVFFSVHKFVGGVQTPGVLVAKKRLFRDELYKNRSSGEIDSQ